MKKLLIASIAAMCTLSACNKQEKLSDLREYVKQAQLSSTSKASELPNLNMSQNVEYASYKMRDPFVPLKKDNNKQLSESNPLRNYPLESIHLVGVLAKQNKYWAAIQLPSGQIIEVGLGAKIGHNGAIVETISPDSVVLKERLPDAQGGHAKQITMSISNGN